MSALLALLLLATPSAEAQALLQQEARALDGLEGLDREIVRLAAERRAMAADLEAAQAAADAARRAVQVLTLELGERRQRVQRRLALHRRVGERAALAVVSRSEDPAAYLRQREALRRILAADLTEAAALTQAQARLAAREAEASTAEATVIRQADGLAAQRAKLERKRGVRAEVLRALQAARRTHTAQADQLARQAGLDATLVGLGAEATGPDLAADAGRLPPPVPGRVLHPFGRASDEDLGHIFHKGVTFDAPRGAPARAVFDGTVAYADWYAGFGHLVLLDHGHQWFSLYAHLDRIAVQKGHRIGQGAVVGDVGDTGRLGGPALYFELRRGAEAVDPARWLRGLEVGPPAR
ncbi:MAG: M23 family metallopeptidase [Myxococcales bacterium]|nr:M23 family metallopeptidase [Myxococcales bacterium]